MCLEDLDPYFTRKRQRFPNLAYRGIAVTVGLGLFLHALIDRLSFIDDYMDIPIFRVFLYYLASIILVPFFFYSLLNFLSVDLVEIQRRDGKPFARLIQSKKQREKVEEFLQQLLHAIDRRTAEISPR